MEDPFGRNFRYGFIPELERARKARLRAPHGRGAHPRRAANRPSLVLMATHGKARACDLHNLLGSLTVPEPHWYRIHPL